MDEQEKDVVSWEPGALKVPVVSVPIQIYHGSKVCNFRPAWDCLSEDIDLRGMLDACHDADPDELTPLLMLADLLDERNDSRAVWVRVACDLWVKARALKIDKEDEPWNHEQIVRELTSIIQTTTGWRLCCLWGYLVAWHGPSGYGGIPSMGRTWVDANVQVISRSVLWWALGLTGIQVPTAWIYADLAWQQAHAAWKVADDLLKSLGVRPYPGEGFYRSSSGMVWQRDEVMRLQALIAKTQAGVVRLLSKATVDQDLAVGRLADVVDEQIANVQWWQACTQGYSTVDTLRSGWQFIASLWLLCKSKLSVLEEADARHDS